MDENRFFYVDDKVIPAHQLAASILDFSRSRDVNKHKLLRGTGIFNQDLVSDRKLSALQLLQLMGNAQSLTPGHDCGFLLGKRMFPGNYGAISNALMHSRNLADAFTVLAVLRSQICPFLDTKHYASQQRHYVLITDAIGCGERFQFIAELYCTALVSAVKLILGQRIPFQFNFPFPRPKYIQEYEVHLGHRLNFSQPAMSISFDKKWLASLCINRSDSLKRHALRQCKMVSMPSKGFIEAVRTTISKHSDCGLQKAAEKFCMSPATFKRKLKQHGYTFQQIHDEVGKQEAIYLLQVQQLSNEETAHLMQFSDIPNFRRSVKRWTGLTPSQLRTTTENPLY
ncbi:MULTISPECIES: AraC family transcriptional regulator [Alteromonadaceae]|uniref:AraC family transcriptional regulator n=1 Tax=Alteromonadaceae TaxID=72275 RepID=UPI001C09215F|nr:MULTISPECIES: AraC family transcriptional regulator ligand-binding domain-containing protein [Aliiglaciecola]MBU2876738.1 AraC family transcriptional regulator ligand-binding domain-containing protein [Aliiglaciecola lipolytica]MDO6710367.1 AraC family transcriptional regulator ligand-binding domain-containing protein [Aliiglaciecola sp. 2_MG-2023]MDO6751514.1 AraC family transcriptional regulator ligand-binding domain-containing protein [Aliiglaciecola sp. 1_MG-2023]